LVPIVDTEPQLVRADEVRMTYRRRRNPSRPRSRRLPVILTKTLEASKKRLVKTKKVGQQVKLSSFRSTCVIGSFSKAED
jgi:hypothetical protein